MQAACIQGGTVHRPDLEAIHRATDLEWRLARIPADATCRGVFFNMLDARALSLSAEAQAAYRSFFRVYRFAPFRMYPVGDYLTRLLVLAQIEHGDDRIYDGLRELQSGAFDAWAGTLLGRAALAVVEPSLPSVLSMLERAYAARTVVSYSTFRVVSIAPDEIVTEFDTEYVYIQHAMVGALEGVARVCSVRANVTAELDGPFDGRVRIALLPSAKGAR